MKKLLYIIGALLVLSYCSSSNAWTQRDPLPAAQCSEHAIYGAPVAKKTLTQICRQAYLVGYDADSKIPEYVEWTLTPDHALGCVTRSNAFTADNSVKGGATPDDYTKTGYDKGHMAPDGDQSWDQQVEYESFLMTNMTPQAGSLNRGIWKLLETSFRGWVVQGNTNYTAISGAVYDNTDKKIGNGVVVPHAFFKVVFNDKTGEYAGWEFPHVAPYPNLGNDLTKFRKPVKDIMTESNIIIMLPKNGKELAPGKEWSVDFGQLTSAKKTKCGANAKDD